MAPRYTVFTLILGNRARPAPAAGWPSRPTTTIRRPRTPTKSTHAKMKLTPKHKSSGWVDRYNIRLMPHGGVILIPITLITIAWLVSISSNGCDYARLTGPGVELLTGSSVIPYIHLGMDAYIIPEFYPMSNSWMVSIESECIPYQFTVEDSPWIAGKRFSFLSLWAGGAAATFLWIGTFIVLTPRQWKAAGIIVLFAALFQVLSFTWFSTALCDTSSASIEDFSSKGLETAVSAEAGISSCTLFYGSRCSIASLILYWIASFIILFAEYPIPEPKLLAEENYQMLRMARS